MYRLLFANDFSHVLGSRSYVSGLLFDTRVVALLGLRTRRDLITGKVQGDRMGRQTLGASLENSANAILIKSKTGEEKFALCLIPALSRLDVNRTARKKLGARKVSFASPQDTLDVTRMEIGGVTPLGLPQGLPVWVDEGVMAMDYVILGGGNKTSKIKVSPKILQSVPNVEIVPELAK